MRFLRRKQLENPAKLPRLRRGFAVGQNQKSARHNAKRRALTFAKHRAAQT